jgi:hypothetical protein
MERQIVCFAVPSFEIALARLREPSLAMLRRHARRGSRPWTLRAEKGSHGRDVVRHLRRRRMAPIWRRSRGGSPLDWMVARRGPWATR